MTKSFNVVVILAYMLFFIVLLPLSITNHAFFFVTAALIVAIFLFYLFLTRRLNLYHYVSIMIPSIILSPFIQTPAGLPAIKLEDLWLLFGLILLILKIVFNKGVKIEFPSFAKFFLVFMFWIAVTIFLSSYREPHLYSNRDWLEIYKNVKLLAIMLIAVNVKSDEGKTKKVVNTLLVSLLIASVFGILQFFNLFNINSWLTPYFIFESNVSSLENQGRVVSTFGNPNIFAGALLLGIAFSLSELLGNFKIKNLAYFVIFLVALTMSQSRTVIVVAAVMGVYMLISILIKSKNKIKSFTMILLVPIISGIGLIFAPERFFYRMSFLGDISSDGSFQARLYRGSIIFENRTKDHIFFGTGPVSTVHIEYDNEWLALLTQYGIVGVILFVIFFMLIFRSLGKINSKDTNYYVVATKGLILGYAMYMITLPVFLQLQLMPIIILMLGIVLNKSAAIKKTKLE